MMQYPKIAPNIPALREVPAAELTQVSGGTQDEYKPNGPDSTETEQPNVTTSFFISEPKPSILDRIKY